MARTLAQKTLLNLQALANGRRFHDISSVAERETLLRKGLVKYDGKRNVLTDLAYAILDVPAPARNTEMTPRPNRETDMTAKTTTINGVNVTAFKNHDGHWMLRIGTNAYGPFATRVTALAAATNYV